MPWTTPSLATVRQNNRDYIVGKIGQPLIPNDYPRVLADANGGNAHLNLQYLDWQADQYLPDKAEQQFLERWANLFLTNADGSKGRQSATYSAGTVLVTATVAGTVLPGGSFLTAQSPSSAAGGSVTLTFQTVAATAIAAVPTPVAIRSLDAGAVANLAAGSALTLSVSIAGIDSSSAVVASLANGTDQETLDALRVRVLERLQKPPMGGDADDYVAWARQVPGVTRAWTSPLEMGVGTCTLRFMMDNLRATSNPATSGIPTAADIATVKAYIETKRQVSFRDFYVMAPIAEPVSFTITNLSKDTPATRAAITTGVAAMIRRRAQPARAVNGVGQSAQTIYVAWVSDAILAAAGVRSFDLTMTDHVMPSKGSLAVLGSIFYG